MALSILLLSLVGASVEPTAPTPSPDSLARSDSAQVVVGAACPVGARVLLFVAFFEYQPRVFAAPLGENTTHWFVRRHGRELEIASLRKRLAKITGRDTSAIRPAGGTFMVSPESCTFGQTAHTGEGYSLSLSSKSKIVSTAVCEVQSGGAVRNLVTAELDATDVLVFPIQIAGTHYLTAFKALRLPALTLDSEGDFMRLQRRFAGSLLAQERAPGPEWGDPTVNPPHCDTSAE